MRIEEMRQRMVFLGEMGNDKASSMKREMEAMRQRERALKEAQSLRAADSTMEETLESTQVHSWM